LLVNTLQGVTLVPSSTIQQNGSASFVYVIQNDVALMRSVKPGVTDGGLTQVEGINPGMWSRTAPLIGYRITSRLGFEARRKHRWKKRQRKQWRHRQRSSAP